MPKLFFVLLLLFHANVWPASLSPFEAECKEGETHRYDSNNGFTRSGQKIEGQQNRWIIEKWGDLSISWDGGKRIWLGQLEAAVLHADFSTLSAATTGIGGRATNLYSFVINFQLGEAAFSQVQASTIERHAAIKVRSQNLKCKILINP